MDFVSWPKAENSYQSKIIDKFLFEFPELANETFHVAEKVDGSNLQLIFEPGGEVRVATRKRILEPGERFFGVWTMLERYTGFLAEVQAWVDAQPFATFRLFGEYFGGKVQGGTKKYGATQRWLCFGAMVNDELQPPEYLNRLPFLDNMRVPYLGCVQGLEAALAFDIGFNTLLSEPGVEPSLAEGIVFQPFRKVYRLGGCGSTFLMKKKNEWERNREPKPPKPTDSVVAYLATEFLEYVTEARLQSVFSKEGPIEDVSDIGRYIRLVIDDAVEDFSKSFEQFAGLDKGQRGQVTKVGSKVARMLKAHL